MQFLPSTFREYAVDGDGDERADIWNEKDAIFTAANFLAHRVEENKRNPQRSDKPLWWAIWDYNHADWYADEVLAIAKSYESEETVPVIAGSSGKLVYPLAKKAELTSGFGMRVHPITGENKMHAGIDLAVPVGTPVLAAQGGVVTRAGSAGGYGYMVEIYHGGGLSTRYGHLSKILVQVGQLVQPGQPIALSGATGLSTGPHLHFETRVNGVPQDPLLFLR
jgi:murein DD-endopeptidase MepM/ murein hydrolase activator NlpD